MTLFKKAAQLSQYLLQQQAKGLSVGFVPTMGALHQGHLSLIETSRRSNELTVCSIFVNPTQFNNPDDLKKYPVTVEEDIEKLLKAGCDVLFLPTVEEIYPSDYKAEHYDLGSLESLLEGRYRPGHFQGVCQVVDRLLTTVQPDCLYLGQKDYQQCMVIERLIEITGRKNDVSLTIVPTEREADGLAMSSRNLRLNAEQRAKAPLLYQALREAKSRLTDLPIESIAETQAQFLRNSGFSVDYFELADARTLQPARDKNANLVALVAAHLDGIRLIDNLPLN